MNPKSVAAFVASLTPVLGLFVFWEKVEPALNWFVRTSAIILQRPQVQAVLVAMTIGVLAAGTIPHWAPARWAQGTTKAVTRFVCAALTFVCCYWLTNPQGGVETRTALIYALLAALAAPQVWTTLAGLLYRVSDKPASLL